MPPRINMTDVTLQQMTEYLMINNEEWPLTRIEDMLLELYDMNILTHEIYRSYIDAINRLRFHGELPGLTRFIVPCDESDIHILPSGRPQKGIKLYFIPALRVIIDNYLLLPSEIQTIRLYWEKNVEIDVGECPSYHYWEDVGLYHIRDLDDDGYWLMDEDGDAIDFSNIIRDLDAIAFTFENPDRPVSPLGLDEFPFDPNDVPTEHLEAAQILYQLWQRGHDGMTDSETDGELSDDDTEMGEFVGF